VALLGVFVGLNTLFIMPVIFRQLFNIITVYKSPEYFSLLSTDDDPMRSKRV
jgi:hypothetical protein